MSNGLAGLGLLSCRGDDAAEFVRAWHGNAPYDWLIALSLTPGQGRRLETICAPWTSMLEMLEGADLDELAYRNSDRWNLYHSAGYLIKKPERGRRSGKNNVRGVPGVWLDLDVKDGSFTSEEEALDFVHTFPVEPTILVATGTGGVQAYWKCDEVLEPNEAEELCKRWWLFAQSVCDVKIDSIQNRDRILRLPGSIRWPKSDEEPALARLLSTGGPTTPRETLRRLTEEVHAQALQRKKRAYDGLTEDRTKAVRAIQSLGRWDVLQLVTELEERFNETYGWPEILEPMGWTIMGEDYDGRTLWMRPGGTRKSAATDYEGSDVMSLFSDAEETGLRRLHDAEVALTKYRVFVELRWNGDEEGFVRAWVKQLQDEGKVE